MLLFPGLRQWLLIRRIHRATAFMDRSDPARALKLWERIVPEAEHLLGREHVIPMTAREDLARCYFRLGDASKAKELMESALADLERVLGTEAEPTLNGLDSLGAIYGQLGDFEQATRMGQRAVSGFRAAFGEDYHGFKRALENLLITYRRADDPAGQRQVLERILRLEERLGGVEAPEVTITRRRLDRAERDERAAALLSSLSLETGKETEAFEVGPLIARCIDTLQHDDFYHTRLSISDAQQTHADFRADYSKPDRFHVQQRALDDEATELFDEWITISGDHYQNVGAWVEMELSDERRMLNRFLLSGKYLDLLRSPVVRSSRGPARDGVSFVKVEFQSIPESVLPDMGEDVDSSKIDGSASVWIESETARLAGAEIRVRYREGEESINLDLHQVFCAHDATIEIEPPERMAHFAE